MGAARGLMVCWRIPGVCVLLGVALAAAPARAGGIQDADLSLRLPAALTRFAPYADVAAVGGASAASKWSSSVNPASVAWQPIPGTLHLSFSRDRTVVHDFLGLGVGDIGIRDTTHQFALRPGVSYEYARTRPYMRTTSSRPSGTTRAGCT